MIPSDLTIIEVIGLAIVQEIAAHKRYQLLSQRVTNPVVKEKFQSLAQEEKSHRVLLYGMLQKYTGEEKPPLPKKAPRENIDADVDRPIHEVIEFALEKEREAEEFYREAAERAQDPSGRQILEYLSKFESGHARSLQLELDALTKYPQWFEIEGADIQLVGP
ncbi:MAG: ferritin family protein [Candidatus Electryoneaceae bacterium]|nr:ferritin family protein [Candidatus Electryoneaceae bacterium]